MLSTKCVESTFKADYSDSTTWTELISEPSLSIYEHIHEYARVSA